MIEIDNDKLLKHFTEIMYGTRGSNTAKAEIINYKNGNSITFDEIKEEYIKYQKLDEDIEKYAEDNNLDTLSVSDRNAIIEQFKDKVDIDLFSRCYGILRDFTDYMIRKIEKENENYIVNKSEPKAENLREFDYMMLDRLRLDCDYFLGNGNGNVDCLYYKDIDKHIDEMKRIYNSFSEEEKPEWINLKGIDTYKEKMTQMLEMEEEAER